MSGVPVLETERLVLREHRPEDLDAYHALWGDPHVIRFISRAALTREQAWDAIIRHRGMWAVLGFGFWVIEDRQTGKLVGEAGVQERCRDIQPSIEGTLEAGWILRPEVQGRGMAREAMERVIGWAGAAFPGVAFTCIIDPENAPSLKLAERLGFGPVARTSYKEKPNVILQRR
ncbi:GNAT family N-acetyltransferase [Chelativorans sp. AA-79]|uniref:GNAT family N-acetyltransferase n=1 Tax=Chelativorans sp. AA-79 TaxID=3028735 RepID=UPI0023F72549|nr:GNAT family N-acetyltransferase [Chelativorans sp. AA-79]WEX09443.1 GNAT family N-acetyltransferase [Chelativorans sp. AA-79]